MARTKQNKQVVPETDQASTAGEDWNSEMGTATATNNSAAATPSFIVNDTGMDLTQAGETTNEKTMEEIRRDIRSKRRATQTSQIARPKTVKKNAAAATAGGKKSKKRTGRHAKQESFKRYIYKVLKQVHPEIGMDSRAMSVMESMVHDMLDRLAREASTLVTYRNPNAQFLYPSHVKTAVSMTLPGDLALHANQEAKGAMENLKKN